MRPRHKAITLEDIILNMAEEPQKKKREAELVTKGNAPFGQCDIREENYKWAIQTNFKLQGQEWMNMNFRQKPSAETVRSFSTKKESEKRIDWITEKGSY